MAACTGVENITVNGNLFHLSKNVNNNDPVKTGILETNDMITDGFWDSTTFWRMAVYLGGDINVKTNWNDIDSIEDIVLI